MFAEETCKNKVAHMIIYDDQSVRVGSYSLTQEQIVSAMEGTIEIASFYGNVDNRYTADLEFKDTVADMIPDWAYTNWAWNPLCFVAIPVFELIQSEHNMDNTRVSLTYNMEFELITPKNCRNRYSFFTLNGEDFYHTLSQGDIDHALAESFKFTAIVPDSADDQYLATITFGDTNAPFDAWRDHLKMFEQNYECRLEVVNFCLVDMLAVEMVQGETDMTWFDFHFTVEVRASEGCGHLRTEFDIVRDSDNMYLGSMGLDHEVIVRSIDCDCVQEFELRQKMNTTDIMAGQYYGQLEITNDQDSFIKVTDSCMFDFN